MVPSSGRALPWWRILAILPSVPETSCPTSSSARSYSVGWAFDLCRLFWGCAGICTPYERTNATVVPSGKVTQPFFSVTGQAITGNGQQVQVYEYTDEDSASADAARISRDGSRVGNTIVDWIVPPHFDKKGQTIVLYLGSNTSIMPVLATALGPQFAGRYLFTGS